MSDKDIPDWVKVLIALGLGALAISILAQIFSGTANPPPVRCPHCGAPVRKWARECPSCRRPLAWT
jgi:predicted amidophosphoribosyltransferase